MFLRRVRPRGKGRRQEYWVLLESYRTAQGSRQRVVAYLGKLSGREISGWQTLTGRLGEASGRRPLGPGLFDGCGTGAAPGEGADDAGVELVDLKNITLRNLKEFGPAFLAWTLWRLLGLDELLSREMPAGAEDVPWATTAAILCLARFCRPSSELFIERQWYPNSALEDLLGVPARQVHTDRLYGGLDKLLKSKLAIEAHLRTRLGRLFALSYELLLYDLTSSYFEGACAANPMAQRGYSRDSRPDCLQVVIALIVTVEGYPMGYEVFAGNTADSTTVQGIVEKVEKAHGQAQRIWVMDRGNVSEANLAFIRKRQGKYIVGTPKALLRQVRSELTDEGWLKVREGLEVKRVALPQVQEVQDVAPSRETHPLENAPAGSEPDATGPGQDTLILCRSDDRVAKEQAMLDRFVRRMEEGLEKMKRSIEKGRLKDPAVAQVRLGRLKEKNWRAAECFQVTIDQTSEGRLSIAWTREEHNKRQLCGYYLLRTNVQEIDPVELWRRYIQLVDAEWAFRISKDELELRPIWHQHAERVQGHILVCFIAYAMWKTLGGWMKASGLGDAPREVLHEMATIKSGEVLLPTRHPDGSTGPTLLIRCVTRPDAHVEVLLNRLGLELPNHLLRQRLPPASIPPPLLPSLAPVSSSHL